MAWRCALAPCCRANSLESHPRCSPPPSRPGSHPRKPPVTSWVNNGIMLKMDILETTTKWYHDLWQSMDIYDPRSATVSWFRSHACQYLLPVQMILPLFGEFAGGITWNCIRKNLYRRAISQNTHRHTTTNAPMSRSLGFDSVDTIWLFNIAMENPL